MKAAYYDPVKVRKLREQSGLSKMALAVELGVSLQTIYRVENGDACSTSLLRRIAKFFDSDWRLLLLENPQEFQQEMTGTHS